MWRHHADVPPSPLLLRCQQPGANLVCSHRVCFLKKSDCMTRISLESRKHPLYYFRSRDWPGCGLRWRVLIFSEIRCLEGNLPSGQLLAHTEAPGSHRAHLLALSHLAQTPLLCACGEHPTSDGELTTCQGCPFHLNSCQCDLPTYSLNWA